MLSPTLAPRRLGTVLAASVAPEGTVRRALGSVPGALWLIVVLHLLIGICHTAVFPNFRAPDERQHVDLIVMVAEGEAWPWPAPGTLHISEGTSAGSFTRSNTIPGRLHLSEQSIPPRGERPSYLDRGGTAVGDNGVNQLVQHPPLYYLAGAAVLSLVPGWEYAPFDRVFMILRWWNVLLLAALPMLLYATARRLRLPDPVPLGAALVPLAIPELIHTGASVNNDNLLVVLAAAAALLVARVLSGDTTRRTAVAIGAVASLALLTKGFALVIPAWVGLAYLVAAVRYERRTALVSLAIAWAAMLPGLAWWIRNKLVYGMLQPHGSHLGTPDLTPRYGWSDGGSEWLARLVDRMITLFFVHDQTSRQVHNESWWMARVALALLVLGILAALVFRAMPRVTSLVLLAPTVGLAAIVVKGSWEQFAAHHLFRAGMQGRYLYAGLVGLAVVAVAAASRLPDRWRRSTPLALLGFAAVMQLVYLVNTAGLFWVPREGPTVTGVRSSLVAMAYWYPFPSGVLVPAVGATIVVGVVTVGAAVRLATAETGSRPAPDPVAHSRRD